MFTRFSRARVHVNFKPPGWKNRINLPRMMFSTEKDINRLRETAKIAQKVIRMIQNPFEVSELEKQAWGNGFQIEKVKSYALAERIKNALNKLDTYTQSRDDVLRLFTQGVVPPENIFNQSRIQFAKVGPQRDRKFIYCPNSIISRQIFSILSSNPPRGFAHLKRFLIKGYKGVSKTVSVSLLWHLTQLIDQYRFYGGLTLQQIKEKFNQPKIVYWSLLKQDTQKKVLEKLFYQLPQLKKVYSAEQIIKEKIDIGKFYIKNFGVQVHFVIDQIHSLAKLDRQIQEQIQEKGKKNYLVNQQKDDIDDLIKLLRKIAVKFSKTIYLSSMDIQQDFLRKCDLNCDQGHQIVKVNQVEYASSIYNQESLTELCHFFTFEFNQMIFKQKNIPVSNQDLRQAEQECFKYLKQRLEKQHYFFVTFINIFKQVQEYLTFNFNSPKVTDFKQFLIEQFKRLMNISTQYTTDQFNISFFKRNKLDQNRKFLLLKLSFKIDQIIKKQDLQMHNQASPSSQSDQIYKIKLEELDQDIKMAERILPKTFFSSPNIQKNVTLRLPAKFTYQLIQPKISQWLSFYLKNAESWMNKSSSLSSLAGQIQRLFVFALKNGSTNFGFQYKSKVGKSERTTDISKYYKIRKGSYPFKPLKAGDTYESLLQLLKPSLQRMMDENQMCAVLEPVTSKFAQMKLKDVKLHNLHETSKGIDFILAKRIQTQQKIELNLIDVTVQNSLSIIEQKMNDFLEIFFSLKDKHQNSIQLKYRSQKLTIPVQLRYFIFCQKNQNPKLFSKLKESFDSLNFEGLQQTNSFSVSFKDKSTCLLSQVGFINIEKDVKFEEKDNIDVLSFIQACKVLDERRKQKSSNKSSNI